jgi:ketosteroid isomerase-like protein
MSNEQSVRDAYDCFGRGDIPTLLDMIDPNIQWSGAEGNPYQPSGTAWHGPDAIVVNLFIKIGQDFDGTFVVHPKDFYDAGETVVVEGLCTRTIKTTGPIAPKGRSRNPGITPNAG